jgi:transketolase
VGVGMALAARMDGRKSRVFVIVGDGECNEGSVWEAALSAAKHRLDNFWILVDANGFQSYDRTDAVCPLGDLAAKWKSFGFSCDEADMIGNPMGFTAAIGRMALLEGPKCVICRTIKGQGSPTLEGNLSLHHIRKMTAELRDRLLGEIKEDA